MIKMKLFPTEPEVSLYNEGFYDEDILKRGALSVRLSDLVERIDDPMVICLDGKWGSGKSYFLKRWVGSHVINNGGTAKTIYFDAFRHDFLDDPLIALTSAISERFNSKEKTKIWKRARAAASALWRPAVRIGLAAASAGVSEAVGAVADAAVDEAADIASDKVEEFWRREDGRKGAMAQFRAALEDLTRNSDGDRLDKLVVVVDELDRCRPDYALSLLEVAKHFFDVPGVHFVLGLNSREFENIVRVRYGATVSAQEYLQKFISLTLSLPEEVEFPNKAQPAAVVYFRAQAKEMEINRKLVEEAEWYFEHFSTTAPSSLRHSQKILTEMALVPQVPNRFEDIHWGYRMIITGLIVQKHINPEFIVMGRSRRLTMRDVEDAFDAKLEYSDDMDHHLKVLHRVWASCLDPEALPNEDGWRGIWGRWGLDNPQSVIPDMIAEYLDTVKLGDEVP